QGSGGEEPTAVTTAVQDSEIAGPRGDGRSARETAVTTAVQDSEIGEDEEEVLPAEEPDASTAITEVEEKEPLKEYAEGTLESIIEDMKRGNR
ncbi:MAG: hypothetical protein ACUVSI_02150, partial [Actinomycetota bacterium]